MWRCLSASTVEPHGKLLAVEMAQSTQPCPRAGIKTTVEQAGEARSDMFLDPWEDETLHQELRETLRLLLSRLA
jgi:hypothetical protein